MPLLKAYKTELFRFVLYEVNFCLFVRNFSKGPRTIPFSNLLISGIVNEIYRKINFALAKDIKKLEIEIEEMDSEIKQLIRRNSKMLKDKEKRRKNER